jgi:hypothetical protein
MLIIELLLVLKRADKGEEPCELSQENSYR